MTMRPAQAWVAAIAAMTSATGWAEERAAPTTPVAPVAIAGATLYPRAFEVRQNARWKGRLMLATLAGILQSGDEGRSWAPVSPIPQPAGTTERCCGVLYEVPRRVSDLAAGSFLYAATYHLGRQTTIRVYRSDDGTHWRPHSELATGGPIGTGVWEPQFDVARDGALVVFWSDETDPCCSQRLRRARSYDGVTWRDTGDLVRGHRQADRPGMATTARMADGRTAMTYEICGPGRCAVYIRYSRDGWDYGDPRDPGVRVQTAAGQYLAHAPTVAASGDRLLVVGQMVFEADDSVSPLNGRVVLEQRGGQGPWRTTAAPVQVPAAYDNYCPNYASMLVPRDGGRTLMEIASAYDAEHRCRAYLGKRGMR
ncbi:sialidase family protein [uncultured Sphingomonas sp.]|uniref:sialidase family protein n=1 Tax=uncultured Sphingomonas sp. TaxID=158754 RepID=UPI002594AB3F|nr:sialidase family protein [uncultured Sphingomonas sp.]